MRKISSTVCVIVTVATLAACGGGGGNKASSSSSSSGSALSSESSARVADKGAFCNQIINSKAENIGEDPSGAKQALATLGSLSPPDEIKGQWDDYLKALRELADISSDDQVKIASIAANHAQSLSTVSLFISQSCLNVNSSLQSDLSNSLDSLSSLQPN